MSLLIHNVQRGGGLLQGYRPVRFRSPALGADPTPDNKSWLDHCRVGDDQGQNGACALFSMASWSEIVHGLGISNETVLAVYCKALKQLGRPTGSGLTFDEAFIFAQEAGWLPGATGVEDVFDFAHLANQPLLAGYEVTSAWDVNGAGCFDHRSTEHSDDLHAVVIPARGRLDNETESRVYIENSWGLSWGWNGIGLMSESLHWRLNRILVRIV